MFSVSSTRGRMWYFLPYFLVALLSVEVVVLTLQNKKLKDLLNRTTALRLGSGLNVGERVEATKLQTLGGSLTELKYDNRSKEYLLFVFSTSCPHCEKTLPNWDAITGSKKRDNLEIVGICADGDVDATKKYVLAKHPGFYIVSATSDTSFNRKYKVVGFPETILMSGDGIVENIWIGELSRDQIEEIQKITSS